MHLLPLPAFTDNYVWMLHDGHQAWVVDPGDAAPVAAALDSLGLQLAGILVTHHHPDHVGGIDALRERLAATGGRVHGPSGERIPEPVERHVEGDTIDVLGRRFEVLEVPGHTAGHIAYFERDATAHPLLFCGDTLFSAGCGRLFEGTAAQMEASLARLGALPADTRVCCTHEYTLSNLRFAAAVEPSNRERADYTARCEARRAGGEPTLPSTIGLERAVNPFLRCTEPPVIEAARSQGARSDDAVDVFAALRSWKDRFR
ncbi:MAG: hydroxyacylglutathione hydrolase [Pseudomonadota bacterium]|jgi:hydroxyacylglutathione hydrolase|nr:hydroxyacylglutathione hydrolase [Rubrivivax sp.]MCA3257551.1 hydroxyacylglutathione hydrolase [Rubrivivax sp.]MCE2912467.1 hydroxyacylglutathione hydrolase [Rubrivivax sp.]MCZ8029927.1 hydroxyacylglutathione hydrolase [Rubrivivax sp.]